MTHPGPDVLGRSVVVGPDDPVPDAWAGRDRIVVDGVDDDRRLTELVDDLHRRWVRRVPTVVELRVPDNVLAEPQTDRRPLWELGAEFTLLRDRLLFLVWNNSYDARRDPPRWWWDVKARTIGATPGGARDIVLADGTEAWVDGGPRGAVDLAEPVVSYESVLAGVPAFVPSEDVAPTGLADDQEQAVVHRAGPARIIAPAGSGKTRVLTGRLRHLLESRAIEPESVCALAYNRRAMLEMQGRLRGLPGVNVRTLHSLGWEILQSAHAGLTLLGERDVRRRLEPLVPMAPRPNTDTIGPYLEALTEVRIGLRPPEEVEAGRDDVPDFARVAAAYRQTLVERAEADHDEQIHGAVEVLLARPDIRRHYQHRCRHLLVDEFQDVTPAMLLMIRLLASPALEVFGVGDDDQVIYGYAGADPGYLIEFDRLFPGAVSHPLEVNYRCPVPVVEAAATLLSYNLRRVEKTIRASPDAETDDDSLMVRSLAGAEMAPVAVGLVEDWSSQGVGPDRVAVLTRVNSSLLPVQAALREAGIPLLGGLGGAITDRTVVRATLAWIRLALDPEAMTRADLLEAIRRPSRGLNRVAGQILGGRRRIGLDGLRELGDGLAGRQKTRWDGFCDDLATAVAASSDTVTLLDALIADVGLDRAASALDAGRTRADRAAQTDDLRALRRTAALHPDPASFQPWLERLLSIPDDPEGVTLSTVHRVKGQEWDRVIVFGVDGGSMPHALSDDIEEERRVFHVAVTRGRHSVTIIADAAQPSRFLTELDGSAPRGAPPEVPKPTSKAPADGVRVATGRRVVIGGGFSGTVQEVLVTGVLVRLDTGAVMAVPWGERLRSGTRTGPLVPGDPDPDPELLTKLKTWRTETARRLGAPAYVVFNDATLEALAALRPATEEGLLAVPGIGPAKLESYGDDLLSILGE